MHIVYLSAEVWPFIRVGGLSEVAHDLCLALGARGHQVSVVTPRPRLSPQIQERLTPLEVSLEVPISFNLHRLSVSTYPLGPGVTAYLLEQPILFEREGLYGNAYGDYEDNAERFILYSRASLELVSTLGWTPDIIHSNDWATGLVPLYVSSLYADRPALKDAATVMTVHNLGAQGTFWHYDMPLTGLGWEYFTAEHVEFYGKINFLKAGLVAADLITTVSPSYAKEILTPEGGSGLEGVLLSRRDRLETVINGVDYRVWDPASDPGIAANYDAGNLAPKARCKAELKKQFGLDPDSERPLACFLGRLQDRKGMDLLAAATDHILGREVDLVVMGFGEDHYQRFLLDKTGQFPGRMGFLQAYEVETARQIVAGADILLIPSRYEPCGLHQMHAMRYGAIPVVKATGGLEDTVIDYSDHSGGTGFKFREHTREALLEALDAALAVYADPPAWEKLQGRGMSQDFSWDSAVILYEGIYERAKSLSRQGKGAAS